MGNDAYSPGGEFEAPPIHGQGGPGSKGEAVMRDRRVRSVFLGLILALPLLIHAVSPDSGRPLSSSDASGLELGINLAWDSRPTWLIFGEVVVLGLIFVAYQRHRLLIGRPFRGY